MTKPVKITTTKDKKVSCDGSENNSKHPLVYLNMGDKNEIVCPYCSCLFKYQKKSN